jgi:hypothetical protein
MALEAGSNTVILRKDIGSPNPVDNQLAFPGAIEGVNLTTSLPLSVPFQASDGSIQIDRSTTNLFCESNLNASALIAQLANADLQSITELQSTGIIQKNASSNLYSESTLSAELNDNSSSITCESSLLATGSVNIEPTIVGAGGSATISSLVEQEILASSSVAASSSLSGNPFVEQKGTANLISETSLASSGSTLIAGNANLENSSTVDSNGSLLLYANANIESNNIIIANGDLQKNGSANLASESNLTANSGGGNQEASGNLASESFLGASGNLTLYGNSSFDNIATFSASALVIPPSSCQPPYCFGTGDYCGCSCNCCPPCPCYTTIVLTYQCGSPKLVYESGCECITIDTDPDNPPGSPFAAKVPEFPDFPDFNQSYEDEFVFEALDAPSPFCSIPCATYTITITTSGCCMYGSIDSFTGSGPITLTSIGSGTVCVSGPTNTNCGQFIISVNGEYPCAEISDCGQVEIKIDPPQSLCCECCLINKQKTLLGDCQVQSLRKSLMSRKRIITSGKNSVDQQKLKQRMSRIKF